MPRTRLVPFAVERSILELEPITVADWFILVVWA